jgi:hypothetical protein
MPNELSEKHDRLWWVAAPPAIWAGHFLLSYATAAIWCAKLSQGGSLSGARVAIFVYTGVALCLVAGVAYRGLRQYQRGAGSGEANTDSPEARHHFLGFTLLSLSALSALAIVYEALAAVFIGSCD